MIMPLNESKNAPPYSAFATLSAPGSPPAAVTRAPLAARPITPVNQDALVSAAGQGRPLNGKRPPKRHPAVGMPKVIKDTSAPVIVQSTGPDPATLLRSPSRRPTIYQPSTANLSTDPPCPTSAPSSANPFPTDRHVSTAHADQLLQAREKYRQVKREHKLKVLQDLVIVQRKMLDLRAARLKEKQEARENEQARLRAERMNKALSRLTYTPVPPSTGPKHHGEATSKEQKPLTGGPHESVQSAHVPSHDSHIPTHPSSPRAHHQPPTPAPSTNAVPTPAATPGSPFRRRSFAPTPAPGTYTGGPISNADILVALELMVEKYAPAATHELGMVVRNHEQANAATRSIHGTSKQLAERRTVANRMVITAQSHREVGARLVKQSLPVRMLGAVEATGPGTIPTTAASASGQAGSAYTSELVDEARPRSPLLGLYSKKAAGRRRNSRDQGSPPPPRRRVPSNPYSLDSWFALDPTALAPRTPGHLLSTTSKADLPSLPTARSFACDEPWNLWTSARHTQRQSQIYGHVAAPLAVAAAINLDTSILSKPDEDGMPYSVPQLPAHATMPWEPVSLAAATPITGGSGGQGGGMGGGGGQSVRYANTQARELYKALPQLERVESLSSVIPRVWDTAVLVGPAASGFSGASSETVAGDGGRGNN